MCTADTNYLKPLWFPSLSIKNHWMSEDIPWSRCCKVIKSLSNGWIFTHWPRIVLCSTVSKEFPHSFNDSFLRVLTLIIQLWKNYPLIQLCGVCTNLRDGFDLNVILPNGKGHHCVLQLSSTRYWWGLCKRTFVDHFSFKWSDDLRLCGVHADLAKLDEG